MMAKAKPESGESARPDFGPRVLAARRLLPERFLVVSNRLPYRTTVRQGRVSIRKGLGGLVTALDPILRYAGGTWIGWSGTHEELPREVTVDGGREGKTDYRLRLVPLSEKEYAKGILERLRAIEIMLDRHPDMQGRFTSIQISAPSRTKVHAYQEMRERIEAMVGRINSRFGGAGLPPHRLPLPGPPSGGARHLLPRRRPRPGDPSP
jgi:trehalose-6-phosphate synthase